MRTRSLSTFLVSSALALGAATARGQCPISSTTLGANDVTAYRGFGGSSAFDDAGTRLAIAAQWDGLPATDCGAVYVFREQSGVWTQVAKLQASDASATARFGSGVDLDSTGSLCLIGSRAEDSQAPDAGAAYVFSSAGGAWHQTAKLVASDADAGDEFGYAVALNSAGTMAVVTAPEDDLGGVDAGAAYVFVDVGLGSWFEVQKLVPPAGHAGGLAGSGVAVSANGDVIAVGSRGADRVYAYRRVGSVWALDATLVAGFAVGDLGNSVELDASGNVVLAGANSTGLFEGSAVVWRRVGGVWGAAVELAATPRTAYETFGTSVALSADGTRAFCGAPGGSASFDHGSTYVFDFDGATWKLGAVIAAAAPMEAAGRGEACSADGTRLAVGDPDAFFSTILGHGQGRLTVHRLGAAPTSYCTAKVNSLGCTPAITFTGCPNASQGDGFLVGATQVLNQKNGVFFYGTSGEQAAPFQGGWLCVKPPHKRVALQNSGGNPPPNDCSGAYSTDFNAWIASGADPALIAGAHFAGQWWSRDPGAAFQTGLTAALRGDVAP